MSVARTKNHSYRIADVFQTPNSTKGEVGLEIETIGKKLPESFLKTRLWSIHPDASVKPRPGEKAIEYVFSQPVGRPKVEQAINELLEEFQVNGSEVMEGRPSTSVHVHVNAQQLSVQQVYTWLAVYFIFEEMLVRWAGPHRIGNLFCLRARDAEGLIKMLSAAIKADSFNTFNNDGYRYAAVNVMALAKFGSLEFRALRGTVDKETITTWINVLLAIKDKSLEYKNPGEVLADFSKRSPLGFTNHIIPGPLRLFMFQQPDFQDVLYEGARLVQDFAFSTTWDNKIAEGPPTKRARSKGWAGVSSGGTVSVDHWSPPEPPQQPPPPLGLQTMWSGVHLSTGKLTEITPENVGSARTYKLTDLFLSQIHSPSFTIEWYQRSNATMKTLCIMRRSPSSASQRYIREVASDEYELA